MNSETRVRPPERFIERKWASSRCKPMPLASGTEEMTACEAGAYGSVSSTHPNVGHDDRLENADDTESLPSAIFARSIGVGIGRFRGPVIHDGPHVPFGDNGKCGTGREGTDADVEATSEFNWTKVQS